MLMFDKLYYTYIYIYFQYVYIEMNSVHFLCFIKVER